MSGRGGGIAGWLGDALRGAHALIFWNWKKTRFRARGAKGRAPCQNESDEPKLGLVRCDVVMQWRQPARFRPVCPLLVSTPDGWRCSVPSAQVRPFWGRAAAFTGGAGLAVFLAVTLGVFAFFRWGNGLPLRWTDVAWPGHWSRIRTLQAERLFLRAMDAMQHGRLNEAFLALTSARQRDPGNYRANLLIGQITMFQGSYLFADEVFTQLQRDAPELSYRTAVVYHDTLLMLQRYDRLAVHALEQAATDSGHAALWVRSLLFALRSGADARALPRTHTGQLARLAPHARLLVEAEVAAAGGEPGDAVASLREPFSGPLNPIYMEQQVRRLATLGDRGGAQALLDFYGPLLGDFHHARVQYSLDVLGGDDWAARGTFRQLLALAIDGGRATQLALALIEHPQPEFYREFNEALARAPALAAAIDGPTMWVAGVVNGLWVDAATWQAQGRQPGGELYPQISAVNFASRAFDEPDSVVSVVNVITFPREVVMALLMKMPPETRLALPKRPPPPAKR